MNLQTPETIETLEHQSIQRALVRSDDGGVWSHSTDRSYVIFCVGQKEAQIRRFMRFALRTGLGFKPLHGCYKGKPERSFIINTNDMPKITPFILGQESVLILHSYNARDVPQATLMNLRTKERHDLGQWCQASKKATHHFDSWTFDPMTGTYWVAG